MTNKLNCKQTFFQNVTCFFNFGTGYHCTKHSTLKPSPASKKTNTSIKSLSIIDDTAHKALHTILTAFTHMLAEVNTSAHWSSTSDWRLI